MQVIQRCLVVMMCARLTLEPTSMAASLTVPSHWPLMKSMTSCLKLSVRQPILVSKLLELMFDCVTLVKPYKKSWNRMRSKSMAKPIRVSVVTFGLSQSWITDRSVEHAWVWLTFLFDIYSYFFSLFCSQSNPELEWSLDWSIQNSCWENGSYCKGWWPN